MLKKQINKIISSLTGTALCAVSVGLTLQSCQDMVYDGLDPCKHGVTLRFVYDYNMEFANAFPSQVDCLTLYVYNENGEYVTTRTVTGPELADEDYRMTLDLESGSYHFVAYGGLACDKATFSITDEPGQTSTDTDRRVEIDRQRVLSAEPGKRKLHDMFFGDLTLATADSYARGTVKMMKNTNNIRIVLQQENGGTVDVNEFEFEITDNNSLFNHDNLLITENIAPLSYTPWTTGQKQTGVSIVGNSVVPVPVVVAYAELSTSRLMSKSATRLVIRRKADKQAIVDFPLIKYLELLCSDYYKEPPYNIKDGQEYLDRESNYELFFFLSPNQSWINTHIVVNDWIVRINNIDFS
ncbi:FimB/Mfa2 family fimbrial subunit [uncultured Muribaculum sp.]|uniref:FimB/Mfa2 family fimbrial subunit n=1 Tax=uncultured Muribaculum sp. TaxID=1918613 RepID=UPI0025B1D106|nr:FimB/Mfa2 family fimbrial subunit [uncultured Muribaculum sp.]